MTAFVESEANLENPVEGKPFERSGTSQTAGTGAAQAKTKASGAGCAGHLCFCGLIDDLHPVAACGVERLAGEPSGVA